MVYEWDPKKAESNRLKHGIEFADAVGALEDDWAMSIRAENIRGEQRFVSIGMDFCFRVVVVVYIHRHDNIRLISARPATKRERRMYESKRV